MDQQADAFGSLSRERRLSATRANLRWNVLYQHPPGIHFQHFVDELIPGAFAAANMAFERRHGYLRFRNSVHSVGSGSYSVTILVITESAEVEVTGCQLLLDFGKRFHSSWPSASRPTGY
jgi:hypothetical protein